MERAVADFISGIRPGDVALFFFNGHGMQIDGINYLIPVDIAGAIDEVDARHKSYSAELLREKLEKSGAELQIIILDACRSNPFLGRMALPNGLAAMVARKGTYIAFAAAPGNYAYEDRREGYSRFTNHLIVALQEPGLKLDEVFSNAREGVYSESRGAQLPWTVNGVIGEFYFDLDYDNSANLVLIEPPEIK